jgi:lysozyme
VHRGSCASSGARLACAGGVSREAADRLLRADVEWAERAVRELVEVELSQGQFDALVSFVFNVGRASFKRSTLRRALNAGELGRVPAELRRWVHQGGTRVEGLVQRREQEIRLFLDEGA